MNKTTKPFIATADEETAILLRKLGFQELPQVGNRWMFLNNDKIVFSSSQEDRVKICYTNILCV